MHPTTVLLSLLGLQLCVWSGPLTVKGFKRGTETDLSSFCGWLGERDSRFYETAWGEVLDSRLTSGRRGQKQEVRDLTYETFSAL